MTDPSFSFASSAHVAVLTRPSGQNDGVATRLVQKGWTVLDLPALRLTAVAGPTPDPGDFDLVVFVSGNAVRMFLQACRVERGDSWHWPLRVPAAVVGPASAAALRSHVAFGAHPEILQPPANSSYFDSEALWKRLSSLSQAPGKVLIVRGGSGADGSGRGWLAERFRAAGIPLAFHRAYARAPEPWSAAQVQTLRDLALAGVPSTWVLTSKEGVDAVSEQLASQELLPWWLGCRLLATHPRIAQHLISVVAARLPASPGPSMLQICSPQDDDILAAIESAS